MREIAEGGRGGARCCRSECRVASDAGGRTRTYGGEEGACGVVGSDHKGATRPDIGLVDRRV